MTNLLHAPGGHATVAGSIGGDVRLTAAMVSPSDVESAGA